MIIVGNGEMIIGVPREVKEEEYRVAFTPRGAELSQAGHEVLVQASGVVTISV